MYKLNHGMRGVILTAYKTSLNDGVIGIYEGQAPANPKDAETGALLVWITQDGQPFTPGQPDNGLSLDVITHEDTLSVLSKTAGENWAGPGLSNGQAGYWRYYDNSRITGASTVSVRIQGSVGLANADMILGSVNVKVGVPVTVNEFNITKLMTRQ